MMQKQRIDRIWWRNVQPGEFYNIERHHQIEGGGGSLYIEVPSSMVPQTLDFLDAAGADVDELQSFVSKSGLSAFRVCLAPLNSRKRRAAGCVLRARTVKRPTLRGIQHGTQRVGFL